MKQYVQCKYNQNWQPSMTFLYLFSEKYTEVSLLYALWHKRKTIQAVFYYKIFPERGHHEGLFQLIVL